MKIIELLNKIANGEEIPKKIKVGSEVWNYDEIDYKAEEGVSIRYLFEVHTRINKEDMNEEIEIIEEDKKIEPIKYKVNTVIGIADCVDKINEIIDYINRGDQK